MPSLQPLKRGRISSISLGFQYLLRANPKEELTMVETILALIQVALNLAILVLEVVWHQHNNHMTE